MQNEQILLAFRVGAADVELVNYLKSRGGRTTVPDLLRTAVETAAEAIKEMKEGGSIDWISISNALIKVPEEKAVHDKEIEEPAKIEGGKTFSVSRETYDIVMKSMNASLGTTRPRTSVVIRNCLRRMALLEIQREREEHVQVAERTQSLKTRQISYIMKQLAAYLVSARDEDEEMVAQIIELLDKQS